MNTFKKLSIWFNKHSFKQSKSRIHFRNQTSNPNNSNGFDNDSIIIYQDEHITVTEETSSEFTEDTTGATVDITPELNSIILRMAKSEGAQISYLLEMLSGYYYVFERNYHELSDYMNSFHRPFAFMTEWTPIMFEVNRLIHNFLASAKTLVELTRNIINDWFEETDFYSEYQEQVETRFIDDPVTGFVEGLRNFSLHYKIPYTSPWIYLATNEEGGITKLSPSFVMFKENLLSWEKWPKKAMDYLNKADERIDIETLLEDYYTNVSEFHSWMHLRIREIYSKELEELDELENERKRLLFQTDSEKPRNNT